MSAFETWFTHKGVYTLPDGTRVVALFTDLSDRPRWWFVAEQGNRPDRWGDLTVVVYPNGSVYTYIMEMDAGYPSLAIPCPSDLCLEDIRAVACEPVEHAG